MDHFNQKENIKQKAPKMINLNICRKIEIKFFKKNCLNISKEKINIYIYIYI